MSRRKQMVVYGQAGLLVPLIVTTILAIGIGGGEGMLATKLGMAPAGPAAEASSPQAAHAAAPSADAHDRAEPHGGKGKEGQDAKAMPPATGTVVRELPPIVTNIAMPEDTWIRVESSIVYDAEKLPEPDVTIKEVTGDILSYLRTLSLPQVQGSRGLRYLREDLQERVAIRTGGKVKELLIQGMVVQ